MQSEVKSLNEECGVFGIWGTPDAAKLTYFGLFALQHRGQEGAGITVNEQGRLRTERGLGLLTDVFSSQQKLNDLRGTAAIGHVRYSTAGANTLENVQPLPFNFSDTQFALAHNGNLTNAISLRKDLEASGAIFHSSSDSEILMHLIRCSKAATLDEQVKAALRKIKGGFAYLLLTKDRLYAALDPNGFRPLVVGQLANGAYVVCSETCALNVVGATFKCDVHPGELLIIDAAGLRIERYTNKTKLAICSMEFIYFARPDSEIYGVNVHSARKRMGKLLAREHPADADMVIGVPNSSLSAASGYSEESGLPYEIGLVKNQYSARTFIEPTQELREQGVFLKLSAVKGVVAGKRVVLVDDSIVRGTTSRRIVKLLKDAGAKEVHLRIASPPLRFPCFYGIDIQSARELIAANQSVAEMAVTFGCDSLAFLSTANLIKAINLKSAAPYHGLCVAYFNGDYPTPLYDYQEEYDAEQQQLAHERGEFNGCV
ncbi:amidophosphoribosyltransferase [Loigolactobacillus backii]|uniref:amidophosphoribosyltransferase n=1 Tax=Loigolactobacillus backii TaxID=375175 RepID=UPI0007F0B46D|nr:amidophosphoribosyltransferase [Loigolactobacillus backii]ANK60992.1 amidophosphoribosyltransferase [Loigolactobacillus backii]ANK65951.1 amidophosphoribosyltransferase [Loigolactobacillus backii]ANK68415.1 amidophosphoribosyltransferase [Loigolactobacillus backii]OLF69653.1 amidophosphoribosyltransferase [Loigolactobacillus backii]PIO86676.1 amidophosphoribosyltransferase [Loigolactobacillus backii]